MNEIRLGFFEKLRINISSKKAGSKLRARRDSLYRIAEGEAREIWERVI